MADKTNAPNEEGKKVLPDLEIDDKLANLFRLKGIIIEKPLSRGSYGHVFRGRHEKMAKSIAVKVVFLEAMKQRARDKFLAREIETLKQISQKGHPHIVYILDMLRASQKLFIIMELATGDLSRLLQQAGGPLGESTTARLFSQAASGLCFLHVEHRLAHRDLKCQNALYFGEKEQTIVKLADFGFATESWDWATGQPLKCQTYCGTVPFQSPQVIAGLPYDPYAGDCFSMGVLLFCLLNDRYPFHHKSSKVHMAEQNDVNFLATRYTKTFPADLLHLQTGLLAASEESRLTIQQVIEHAWIKRGGM